MLAWENSGFSVDASVRITLIDRDVPSYFRSLEHLLRYCARPPFALERLSVIRGPGGRIARIRYVLPRHKAATWVGPGRDRKSTRPAANGVVELSPFEFLDRLADLVPPPRKQRHRYHGVFTPNHKLRPAVTSLAIGNVGKRQEAATRGHTDDGSATEGCCDATHEPLIRSIMVEELPLARLFLSGSGFLDEQVEKQLKRGWFVGGESFRERLTDQLPSQSDNLRGAQRAAHDEKEAERLLESALEVLHLSEAELLSLKNTRVERQAVVWLLKKHTAIEVAWLAQRLAMGHRTNASRAISRFNCSADPERIELKRKMLQITG
jgi:hypothetical protein